MFALITSVVFLGLGLYGVLAGRRLKKKKAAATAAAAETEAHRHNFGRVSVSYTFNPVIATIAGWVAIVLAVAILSASIFTTVGAKNAGVKVAFGKVSEETLSPGLHVKMPWQKVIEIDGTIQTDEYRGDACIQVRIGDGSQACISITNRWNVVETEADRVYQDFKSNDPTQSFKDSLISSELMASVQRALSDYNPIAQFDGAEKDASSADLSFSPDYDEIAKTIEADMKKKLDERAKGGAAMAQIESVTISYMQLSENTQKKLDDYVAAIGETRISEQKTQTATAQAAANRILASSVSNDPNVLVSRCMDTLAESAEKGYQLPAGFTCWPGGGTGVVIPGNN